MYDINFGGFYYSDHESFVESAVDSYNSDDEGNVSKEIRDIIYDMDYTEFWGKLYSIYCNDYISILNEEVGIDLKFHSIDSPLFYNFNTDVILCTGNVKIFTLLKYIIDNKLQSKLKDHLIDMTTSKSGYTSFYDIDEIIADDKMYTTAILDVIINNFNPMFFIYEMDSLDYNTMESIGTLSSDLIYEKEMK